jgi:hypothetical protein
VRVHIAEAGALKMDADDGAGCMSNGGASYRDVIHALSNVNRHRNGQKANCLISVRSQAVARQVGAEVLGVENQFRQVYLR